MPQQFPKKCTWGDDDTTVIIHRDYLSNSLNYAHSSQVLHLALMDSNMEPSFF